MSTQHLTSPLLDSAHTAQLLNIPPRTLDQWSYRGIGPQFFKVGRHRRYRQEDVESWLDAQRKGGDAA